MKPKMLFQCYFRLAYRTLSVKEVIYLKRVPTHQLFRSYGPCTQHRVLSSSSYRTSHHSFHNNSQNKNQQKWMSPRYFVPTAVVVGVLAGYAFLRGCQGDVECQDEQQQAQADVNDWGQQSNFPHRTLTLEQAIHESEEILQRVKLERNCPGLVVAVTVDGKEVWSKGFGLADIENLVECKPSTVMRIASISKPLTMLAIARLWEEGKLDLDASVQKYVKNWPDKTFNDQKVTVTTRHLVSMIGGVRHYDKLCRKQRKKTTEKLTENQQTDKKNAEEPMGEFDHKEYYMKKHFPNITTALELFKDDNLCSLPGTEFLYSTYTWTLLSAVIEGASGRSFQDVMKDAFRDLNLEHTYFDEDRPIIPNRARYYVLDKQKRQLLNAPYVDNSYKWAGGGFLSTVGDLCHFANAMLYSFQWTDDLKTAAGYLRPETVEMMWTPVNGTECSWDTDGSYGMGWGIIPQVNRPGFSREQRMYVSHTGGAVGASSVVLILPKKPDGTTTRSVPRGVCVAIITNKQSVGLNKSALKIAKVFDDVQF